MPRSGSEGCSSGADSGELGGGGGERCEGGAKANTAGAEDQIFKFFTIPYILRAICGTHGEM